MIIQLDIIRNISNYVLYFLLDIYELLEFSYWNTEQLTIQSLKLLNSSVIFHPATLMSPTVTTLDIKKIISTVF